MTQALTPTETDRDDFTEDPADEYLQLVSFWIGTEEYAFDILAVREINRMLPITQVPSTPPEVEGVINLRGTIIPVIDLRKRFGQPAPSGGPENRIVVLERDQRMIGFVVDGVNEVLLVDPEAVDPNADSVCGTDPELIRGVGRLENRLLIIVDLERLIDPEHLTRPEAA